MYTINIGEYTVGETTYEDRCLSASIGGIGIQSETIPWTDTNYQPYDFKYVDNTFILDPIPQSTDYTARIGELMRLLRDSDYCAAKIAEGSATVDEYTELIAQRREWREEINQLRGEME